MESWQTEDTPPPQMEIKKKIVDTMIPNVLRDLSLGPNQPPKSADY